MAKFTNDLSVELTLVQHEEILESIDKKYTRAGKELCIKLSVLTGAIVTSTAVAMQKDKLEVMILTIASLAIANSLYNLYIQHKQTKAYKIDYNKLEDIDYRALAKSHRERDRYNGELTCKAPHHYEIDNKEEIEEEFGHPEDNDLPVQFLEQELVPSRVLHEYDLYTKRYNVPEIKITEDELTEFVNKLSELLTKVGLSHRIYYYTSKYFRRLIAKGIINYWDEITFDTLLEELYIFKNIKLSENDINIFREAFKKEEKNKKLK